MSLSTQVKESVQQASDSLRDAIAFAARGEHPIVINLLADMISRLESLEQMDEIMEKFGSAAGKEKIYATN